MTTFIERWVCCGVVDDDDVVANVAAVRKPIDALSVDYVEYSHAPVVHHVSVGPERVVVTDNSGVQIPVRSTEEPDESDEESSGGSGESYSDMDGSSSDDELTDCAYRNMVISWNELVTARRVYLTAHAQGGHPHNHPVMDGEWETVLNGLLHEIVGVVQVWEGHKCQYRHALERVVGIIVEGETTRRLDHEAPDCVENIVRFIEGDRERRIRWIHYVMAIDYDLPCIIMQQRGAGANAAPGGSGNASGDGNAKRKGPGDDSKEPKRPKPSTDPSSGGEDPVVPQGVATSVYRLAQDVVEVKGHRRVRRPEKYVRAVVVEIKNRLGCPAPNAANLLAARRMAMNIMERHGVRPSHIRRAVELVVAGVFVPDEEDLVGAKILQSVSVAALRDELSDAGPKSAWRHVFHPFRERRVERVRAA
nr:hypothetical protein [Tolivirales sp.]